MPANSRWDLIRRLRVKNISRLEGFTDAEGGEVHSSDQPRRFGIDVQRFGELLCVHLQGISF